MTGPWRETTSVWPSCIRAPSHQRKIWHLGWWAPCSFASLMPLTPEDTWWEEAHTYSNACIWLFSTFYRHSSVLCTYVNWCIVFLFCMQLGADKEWSLIFAVFDENKSWYFNENMQKSTQNPYNTTHPALYNANVIYSEFTLQLISICLFIIHFISLKGCYSHHFWKL